jgi:hypothetical protein
MSTLQESIATTSQAIQSTVDGDRTSAAKERETLLQSRLDGLNEQLASKSGGLIAPERMVKVIHDVLNRQHGVTLISLHNKPLFSLVQPNALAAAPGRASAGGFGDDRHARHHIRRRACP